MVISVPTATARQQHERRQAIAHLLQAHAISRQSELVELLRGAGFHATQSSVSRDLKDLGAVKLESGYSLPEHRELGNAHTLGQITEFVHDIRAAGPNLLVVRTSVGAAQTVAVTLDAIDWPEIVGTLSGDDTVFIATTGSAQQRRLRGRLRQSLSKAAT